MLRIFLMTLLFSAGFYRTCLSQKAQNTLTITDVKRFQLQRINENGNVLIGSAITKTFKGSYSGIDQTYTLSDTTGTVLFTSIYPLSRDDLRAQITAALNANNISNNTAFSEYSLNQVFLWLYSLNQELDAPSSGRLNLGRLVIVFDSMEDVNYNNSRGRIEKLESFSNLYFQKQSLMYSSVNKLTSNIAKAIMQIKNYNETNAANLNTNFLANIQEYFANSDYPELDVHGIIAHNLAPNAEDVANAFTNEADADKIKDLAKIKHSIEYLQNLISSYAEAKTDYDNEQKELIKNNVFQIEKISLQFEQGNLERIQVWVQNKSGFTDIYENIYAIGFTDIYNYKNFQRTRLFIRKSPKINDNRGIFLSDVITNYDNLLDLYTRDYSPADTVINEYDPANGPLNLTKARSINLFDSRIYSDLQGIKPDAPNGLIQVEVSKRFNVASTRRQLWFAKRVDYAWFNYIKTYGALNKIENKNKYLTLRNNHTVVNNSIVSPSYATNLDLLRYQNDVIGLNANIGLVDVPDLKFTLYCDVGAQYGHVPILNPTYIINNGTATPLNIYDTLDGNLFTLSLPKLTFEFFSERRIGFNVVYAYNYTVTLSNNQYKQIVSYEKSNLQQLSTEKLAHSSNMLEFNFRIETSHGSNGQLFFRNRIFWQNGDPNTSFVQSQIGYFYNIIFRK